MTRVIIRGNRSSSTNRLPGSEVQWGGGGGGGGDYPDRG